MGLTVNPGILIEGERKGWSVLQIIDGIGLRFGLQSVAISVVSIAELTHGIYCARTEEQASKRQRFIAKLSNDLPIHDLTPSIATMVGRIEGEQAAVGISIDFQDLVIGATALSLNFSVLTTNPKHFQLIPNLNVSAF